MQGVPTNFHIDILKPIVEAAADVCGVAYEYRSDHGRRLRRITDHIRACTMAIHENVYPGPQKEKYVIRRLLRRAVLDGHQMGLREPFLYKLVPAVVQMMKTPYPELAETTQRVADVIKNEEANFLGTLDAGLAKTETIFAEMAKANRTTVNGAEAADLYQTYGVPPEVFETMAAERNLAFDWEGYRRAMTQHGDTSRGAVQIVMGDRGPVDAIKRALHETPFLGYETTEAEAELKFIVAQNRLCDHVREVGHQERPDAGPGPLALLRRKRRPGGRQRRDRRPVLPLPRHRHAQGRRTAVAPGAIGRRRIADRPEGHGPRGNAAPARHPPGPFGDAHPALRLAEKPRLARPAAGLQSGRRLAAIRLYEHGPRPGRPTGGDRTRRQRADRRGRSRSAPGSSRWPKPAPPAR